MNTEYVDIKKEIKVIGSLSEHLRIFLIGDTAVKNFLNVEHSASKEWYSDPSQ